MSDDPNVLPNLTLKNNCGSPSPSENDQDIVGLDNMNPNASVSGPASDNVGLWLEIITGFENMVPSITKSIVEPVLAAVNS
jgi:hypothetical protein